MSENSSLRSPPRIAQPRPTQPPKGIVLQQIIAVEQRLAQKEARNGRKSTIPEEKSSADGAQDYELDLNDDSTYNDSGDLASTVKVAKEDTLRSKDESASDTMVIEKKDSAQSTINSSIASCKSRRRIGSDGDDDSLSHAVRAIAKAGEGNLNSNLNLDIPSEVRYCKNVLELFQVEKELGSGSFGKVVEVKSKETGKSYAAKVIPNTSQNRSNFVAEYRVLKRISELDKENSSNLMHLYDAMIDDSNFYLLCELCKGPLLFDHIMQSKSFSENLAILYVSHILNGLKFLHDNSIVHRDLKPENLVFLYPLEEKDSSDISNKIKIVDFGCAFEISKHSRNTEMAGTPFYLAPEMLLGAVSRTKSVIQATKDIHFNSKKPVGTDLCAGDMWSLGVIVYFMLTGSLPFEGPTRIAVYQSICKGQLKFPPEINLSLNAKDFVSKLLVVNWQDRMTCAEAVEHPWLKHTIS